MSTGAYEVNVSSPPISSASAAPTGSSVRRRFHTRPSTPPGRSTRAASTEARVGSTQCQAWPYVTASALASPTSRDSPLPCSAVTPGLAARSRSSIGSDGSTAMTS